MSRALPALAIFFALSAQAGTDRDTLYQVSTIDALLAGVYDPLAPLTEVLPHGDFGLGTFAALDGEAILLGGQVYQAGADGQVRRVSPDIATPFMSVTFFDADRSLSTPAGQDYAAFKSWLESRMPSRNLAYAIRVDGRFDRVSYRSVPSQRPPYPPLVEVARQQREFDQAAIRGTLVGFWCPDFMQGANVPGFHLHFISEDRRHAGHVLDFVLAEGQAQLDLTNGWTVHLPLSPALLDTPIGKDRRADLHAVEQGRAGDSSLAPKEPSAK